LSELISIEPATGAQLWKGQTSNVDQEVAEARKAWPSWAATSLNERIEKVRNFGNRIRMDMDKITDLIARETGKPLWEARTEVESVIAKVDISIKAYADRTPQRRIEGKQGSTTALRHKPHGVLAVLGPYNFPAHLPNGHIIPALIAGNAVVFKPSEKTPAVGEMLVDYLRKAGVPAGVIRLVQGGPATGKELTACCSPAPRKPELPSTANSQAVPTKCSRSKWAATIRSSYGTRTTFTAPLCWSSNRRFCRQGSVVQPRGA
jgi:succinylglutamic semialdehyde dehydrogenase